MEFQSEHTYRPSFPLSRFVDMIWVSEAGQVNLTSRHHAPLFTELIFNYGDTFSVRGQHVESDSGRHVSCTISGLKTEPFLTEVSGAYRCVGLLLKPFCYGKLLDRFGGSDMGLLAEAFHELLLEGDKPNFKQAEKRLLPLFDQTAPHADLIRFEAFVQTQAISKGAITDFTKNLSSSHKGFIDRFKRHYLIKPNEYFKLRKVNTALELMRQGKPKSLCQIGLEAGFYDQAHFIRSFKKYCGQTPKDFQKNALR